MGFGTGWGGATGWGGTGGTGEPIVYETVTLSENLTVWVPLWVQSATPTSPYLVTIEFSHPLDPTYPQNFSPLNYSTLPALAIVAASPGANPYQVRLQTAEQSPTVYTMVVGDGRSLTGDALDPTRNTVPFAGFPVSPNYFATAQSRSKVMLTFSTTVLVDAILTAPGSYTIQDLNGNGYTVDSVTVNAAPGGVLWVTLELGTDLDPGGYYVCTIDSLIKTASGVSFAPLTDVFQYVERDLAQPYTIPISSFSGEVSSGLLGQPLGQVFFSPSLDAAIPSNSSTIQVDSVSVCTRAFDVYEIPEIPDPKPMMTWGATLPYNASLLNDTDDVLYATADRLGLAHVNLTDRPEDTWGGATDGPADATLQETFDQSRVALLNVDDWVLYDGVGTPFICADNLTPIPAGTTTNINLQP